MLFFFFFLWGGGLFKGSHFFRHCVKQINGPPLNKIPKKAFYMFLLLGGISICVHIGKDLLHPGRSI